LLAHELTHVVQQDGARAGGPLVIQDASDPAEHAADFAADRLAQGRSFVPNLETGSALLQRDGAGSHAGVAGVPAEKWSEWSEETYRQVGETSRADAIRQCRLHGIDYCLLILTEQEASAAYELAKEGYSPREAASEITRSQQSVQKLARAPVTSTAAPWVAGEGTTVATGLIEVGKTVIKRIPAVAVTALFAASVTEEVRLSLFIDILEENGFVVLLNPLGACIRGCHSSAPRARTLPRDFDWSETFELSEPEPVDWTEPTPWTGQLTPEQLDDLEKSIELERTAPRTSPVPSPVPFRVQSRSPSLMKTIVGESANILPASHPLILSRSSGSNPA
jgi:hypothetical protein